MSSPDRLANFEVLKRLGQGGMAEVFLAKKRGAEGTFKVLVLKRIHPSHAKSKRFRSMFVEEAHLATRLNHPNIVQVYEFVDHGDDDLLLAMEYVEGHDFGRLLAAARQKGTRVPPWVSAYIVAEAAKGLHYAHERRDEGGAPLAIVHRDVSPQNILLSSEGSVKLADFGIASANLFREEPGVLKGKFGYMSPEQSRGERVDRRSDIYALGVVLYEALTLRSPYARGNPPQRPPDDELLELVREAKFDPPSVHQPDVPPELEAIVLRAMSRDKADRFQTARDMSGAILRALVARQELIDAGSVETVLSLLLERTAPLPAEPPSEAAPEATMAAIRQRKPGSPASSGVLPPPTAPRRSREVRHVALVAIHFDGLDELDAKLGPRAKRVREGLRETLEAIGYKRGARWLGNGGALGDTLSGIIGLVGNPARAAFDAASLAVDVHEALEGASEDLPRPVRASIGIMRGIASGDRDEQGNLVDHELQEPVVRVAEQLATSAPVGRTWVAGGLYRLVRRDFRWVDAPTIEIDDADAQGGLRTMRVYALSRPLTREERALETALAPNDLVGRDAERADLHAAYHRAKNPTRPSSPPSGGLSLPPPRASQLPPAAGGIAPRGALQSRVVYGEMGIGKTALVQTFLSELPRDAKTLSIECSPVKSEIPYALLCDLLREATGVGSEHTLEEAALVFKGLLANLARGHAPLQRAAARLAEIATGKNAESNEDDSGQFRRDLLLLSVRYLLGALAADNPLVIVLDGLGWADRPSLEIVQDLLRRAEQSPILVVLVTRPEERVLPFLEGLVRIELWGLSAEEQIRLVESRLGVREGVAEVCRDLLPKVAGNPFFLLEMIDALLERGVLEILERPGGRHELRRSERGDDGRSDVVPSTLEQILGDRIRELPSNEHDVVDWLAVARGPLLESDLLTLTRASNDDAIGRLCARGLCDRRQSFVDFRHPLTRDVAYNALEPVQRVRQHRMLGEHLAATPVASGLSAAIVAWHLSQGDAPAHAAELYLEAASTARVAHQTALAQRYYLRALSLLPEGDARRLGAHEALEVIYRNRGRRRERRAHLSALRRLARSHGSRFWVATALIRTARFALDEGLLVRAAPAAQQAAEIARASGDPNLEVEALTILSETLRDVGDLQGAIEACDRALAVAASGRLHPRIRAEVTRAKGVLLRYVGRVNDAVGAYVDAIAVFRAVGARRSEARALNALAFAMFVLERFEDVIALGLESIRVDLAVGERFHVSKTLTNVGQAYARLGDLGKGLAYLRRALESHERYADQQARADTLLVTAELMLEGGDADAAHSFVSEASALLTLTGSVYDLVHERIVRSMLARAAGDYATAITLASEARRRAEAQGLISFHLYAKANEALARALAGEPNQGALLARMALAAVESAGGSEYGLEIRALSATAVELAAPDTASEAYQKAAAHIRSVLEHVRDPELRASFLERKLVAEVLRKVDDTPASLVGADVADSVASR